MKVLKRFTLILSLLLFGSLLYSQTWNENNAKWFYKSGGSGDGYAESAPVAHINKLIYDKFVCENGVVNMRVLMDGGSLFSYKWRAAVNNAPTLSETASCRIPNCDFLHYNGKKFICEITDLRNMQISLTDTIILTVVRIPEVRLNWKKDTTLCLGEELEFELDVPCKGAVYTWSGGGIVGDANRYYATVRPEVSTRYKLTVNNQGCVDSAAIQVNVIDLKVDLPAVVFLERDEPLKLAPAKETATRLDWVAGSTAYADKNVLEIADVTNNMLVTVKATQKRCTATATAKIYTDKNSPRYAGGEEDGFAHSKTILSVTGIKHTKEVCEGDNANFMLNIQVNSSYIYQWKKVGDNTPLPGSDSKLFVIENCNASHSGEYFCECTDLDTGEKIETEPVLLTVMKVPTIAIDYPVQDTTLCLGEKIELKATPSSDSGKEKMMWTGGGILGDPTRPIVSVRPTADSTVYRVFVDNGVCRSSAQTKVFVRKNKINIPKMLEYSQGDPKLVITVPSESGAKYAWKMDGIIDQHTPFEFIPTKSTVISVTKWINSRCPVYDTCRVFVKDFKLEGDYAGDGYATQNLTFSISKVISVPKVCINQAAEFDIHVTGYGIYRYLWKTIRGGVTTEVGNEKKLSLTAALEIHSGSYFCEVTEVESGLRKYSDTVDFRVMPKPEAVIDFPENGVEICAGSTIELAVVTKPDATYLWGGLGIVGETTTYKTTVQPEETTTYSVIVSNGICFDQAFVGIVVKKPEMKLPRVIRTVSDQIVTIDPKIPNGATIEWLYSNNQTDNAKIFNKNLKESTQINVTMEFDDCVVKDSVRVYVKQVLGYRGGIEDGFFESDKSFKILGVNYEPTICENTVVDFTISVSGSGLFSYCWKQVGKPDTLGTERILSLTDRDMSLQNAAIYCEVTDLQRGEMLSSDPKTLTVKRGPKAIIGVPERGKLFCLGAPIVLDARKTEESKLSPDDHYTYDWIGENIETTNKDYQVTVRPTESQVYTLRVDFFGCVDMDTMTIHISKPKIDVPTKEYVRTDETIQIKAVASQVSVGATIGWMYQGLFTPNVNPFVLSNPKKSGVVTAIVREVNGCEASDSTLIYVRANNTYRGGEDDGFMESCEVPVIENGEDQKLGCGGNDSIAMVVSYVGEVEVFSWEKYNEATGDYEKVTEADNRTGLGTATLIMKPVNGADIGTYRCVLSNACGYVSTKSYTVSNGQKPQLGNQIPNRTVTYCELTEKVELSIPVIGDGIGISYRWYKKNAITGVLQQLLPEVKYNNKSMEFTEVKITDAGLYLIEAENDCGTTTDSVKLIVNENIQIIKQPTDTVVCVDSDVRLWCLSSGGATQSYQLLQVEKDKKGGYTVLKTYDAFASNFFDFEPITQAEAGDYVWKVTADCGGSVSSQIFHMTVENRPAFAFQSNDTLVCNGTPVNIGVRVVVADDNGASVKYRWTKDNAPLAYLTDKISFTVNELSVGNYLCYAKNACPEIVTAAPIVVGLRTVPVVTEHPTLALASYCEDKGVTISAKADILTEVDSIRWHKGGDMMSDMARHNRISGSTTYSLKIDSLLPSDAGNYSLYIYHTCGIVQTRSVALVIDEKARVVREISADPEFMAKVCQGEERTLSVVASGKTPLSYIWLVDNNKVMGAEQASLKVKFDKTATYCCNVVNGCGGEVDCATVNVVRGDTFRVLGSGRYCTGDEGRPISLVASDTNYVYKLYKEGQTAAMKQMTGKEAERLGGVLNFGTYKEGSYYVVGKDNRSLCEFTMPGKAVIIRDTLPPVFNVLVVRPMCEGLIESADIALDTSINSLAVEYTLYKKQGDTWKIDKGLQKGTGDTLTWTDVDAGKYKVVCTDYTSRCSSEMNGQPEIEKRPMPVVCDFFAVNKDSTYCKNTVSDVNLSISKTCIQGGITYTLKKNGADVPATDDVTASGNGDWEHVPFGHYTVEAKNVWGCKSLTRALEVKMDSLPKAYKLFGSLDFCQIDSKKTTVIQLEKAETNVKYELFALPEIKLDEQMGENKAITWDVPMVDSTYYVMATNPKTGCQSEMLTRAILRSTKLKLEHAPVYVDLGNTFMTQFDLKITGALGTPSIVWTSANAYVDPVNVATPTVMFMDDPQISLYHVKVSDDKCIKELDLEVVFTGQALQAQIKNGDQSLIPNDTLSVCQGVDYKLYGSVQGGNGVYKVWWTTQGREVGATKNLEYTADRSAYMYFSVESGLMVKTDSVWVNVLPLPGGELEMVNEGMNCVSLGQNIELKLKNTQENDSYSLLYSKSGSLNTYKATGISKVADASGLLSLGQPYQNDRLGFYGVKVSRKYGKQTCTATYTGMEARQGSIKATLSGGGVYCDVAGLVDTVLLDTSEVASTYRLLVKRPGDPYFEHWTSKQGIDDSLLFTGTLGDGIYKVIAERENSCVDTMSGTVEIKHLPKPTAGPMINSGDYCLTSGQTVNVIIGIENCVDGVSYRLMREEPFGVYTQVGADQTGFGDLTFTSCSEVGRYLVIADDGHCQDTSGQVRIVNEPVNVNILAVDSSYCRLDNDWNIQLKAFKADHLMDYNIYDRKTNDLMGMFGQFHKDTVYYNGRLNEGKYIVKAEIGDCSLEMSKKIEIKMFPEPDQVELLKPLSSCDNLPLTVGVVAAQQNIAYQLWQRKESGDVKVATASIGSGADLLLTTVQAQGEYYVMATNPLTGCSRISEENYIVNPAPKVFHIIAEDTVFCQSPNPLFPNGTRIGLSGVEAGMVYNLQKLNVETGIYVDVRDSIEARISSVNKWWFISPSYGPGKYRVRTNTCDRILMAGELEVIEIGVPADLKLELRGNGCVGENIQIVLTPTENNVTYKLYKNGVSLSDTYMDLVGDGSGLSWSFVNAAIGNYTVEVNKSGCKTLIDTVIRIDEVPKIGTLQGVSSICQYADTALILTDWERVAKYRLFNSADELVARGVEIAGQQVFKPVPVGEYYAVANRGNCEKKSPSFTLSGIPSPDITVMDVSISECAAIGNGVIEIRGMVDTLEYILKYPGATQPVYLSGIDKRLDKLALGDYHFRVMNKRTGCYSKTDTLQLRQSVPADSLVGDLAYCNMEQGLRLTLSAVTKDIRYTLYGLADDGTETQKAELMNTSGKTFTGTFGEGKYILVKKREGFYMPGCMLRDTFDIRHYNSALTSQKLEIIGGPELCAGGSYEIVVKGAQAEVQYILMHDAVRLDTVWGAGDPKFKPVSLAGTYRVLPKTGGVCGDTYLDSIIFINSAPKMVEVLGCTYCYEPGVTDPGCAIRLMGSYSSVKYILTNADGSQDLDTIRGVSYESAAFELQKNGKYMVKAVDTLTHCQANIAAAEIKRGIEPKKFDIGIAGAKCGDKLEIATNNGSEGDSVEYYMYKNDIRISTAQTRNDGQNISFGMQQGRGVYRIYAYKPLYGCGVYMNDSLVIMDAVNADTLQLRGVYCTNETGKIKLRMSNSVPNWGYYLVKNVNGVLLSSDTLLGTSEGLLWSSILKDGKKQPLDSGVYKLYALNACATPLLLDTIKVAGNRPPTPFAVVGGDNRKLCIGNTHEIVLENSQVGVSYELTLAGGTLKIGKAGDGNPLSFGNNFAVAGDYLITGVDGVSGCNDTVAVLKVTSATAPADPMVVGQDVCLATAQVKSLNISLNRDIEPSTSYYLKYIRWNGSVQDTTEVGALREGYEWVNYFQPQTGVGRYEVIANNGACEKVFGNYRVGDTPIAHSVNSAQVSLCAGSCFPVNLGNSEIGVEYKLYHTTVKLDPDTAYVGVSVVGTGAAMPVGMAVDSGTYLVEANNGCVAYMPGSVKVKVTTPYRLDLGPGYHICLGDSVKIQIFGRTNPAQTSMYLLIAPGETRPFSENIRGSADQASLSSAKFYKKPGFYVVKNAAIQDGKSCMEIDSVELKVSALPQVFAISNNGGEYICSGGSKEITLSGNQAGVQYTLYRKDGADLIPIDSRDGGKGQIKFTVNAPGVYVAEGGFLDVEPACKQRMTGEVTLLDVGAVRQIELKKINGSYCYNVSDAGQVQLVSSDAGIAYQLYKDGDTYGTPQQGATAGAAINWMALPGGDPRDPRYPDRKVGCEYTVKAHNLQTPCEETMIGKVVIVKERNVEFNDNHFQNAVTPCIGEPVSLDVQAWGGNLTYEWKQIPSGATVPVSRYRGQNSFLEIPAIAASDYGFYRCVIGNSCSVDSTKLMEIKPRILVEKDGNMSDLAICDLKNGQVVTKTLKTAMRNANNYKWYHNGVLIPGASAASYDAKISKTLGAGEYICTAANDCGNMADTAQVTVDSVPVILATMRTDTLCDATTNYTLSVTSAFPKKWYLGDQELLGETGNSLVIPEVRRGNEGTYYVRSVNSCGTAEAKVATLWVDDTVKVLGHDLVNQSVCGGNLLNLSIATQPDETKRVTYCWTDEKGVVLGKDRDLKGVNILAYSGHETRFSVSYANKCTKDFMDFNLDVVYPIVFDRTFPPEEIPLCAAVGGPVDTALWVRHDPKLEATFQWYYLGRKGDAPELIGNDDTVRFKILTKNTGAYYCKVSNICGDSITRQTWVRIDTIPEIHSSLEDTAICAMTPLVLKLNVSGGNLKYNWKIRKKAVGSTVETITVDIDSVVLRNITADYDGAVIWCEVSNACTGAKSNEMTLTVLPEIKMAVTPATVQVCEGETGLVQVELLEGEKPWTYNYKYLAGKDNNRTGIVKNIDTLRLEQAGLYEFTYLKDKRGCVSMGKLGAVTVNLNEVSTASMAVVGKTQICANDSVVMKIHINSKTQGPWKVAIYRKSDGLIATESGFSEAIEIDKTDTVIILRPQRTETYFAVVQDVFADILCQSKMTTLPILIDVQTPVRITADIPTQRTFGNCDKINLNALFNAQPTGGEYMVGAKQMIGGWLEPDKKTKNYMISYRVWEGGCETRKDLVELTLLDKPEGSVKAVSENICPGTSTDVVFKMKGVYPLKVTYAQVYLKPDGKRETKTFTKTIASAADNEMRISENTTFGDRYDGVIYKITRLEDPVLCTAEVDDSYADTVMYRKKPEFESWSKNQFEDGGLWQQVTKRYVISSTDSVELKVVLNKGGMPWNMNVVDILYKDHLNFKDIKGNVNQFSIKKDGFYQLFVSDKYKCEAFGEYYDVLVADTAFVNLKALLEGPYQKEAGEMASQCLPLISNKGITWPNVGSKSIIDWIEVELWQKKQRSVGKDSLELWSTQSCLLLNDGSIVDTQGNPTVGLPSGGVRDRKFYVALRHRNHLAVMSNRVSLENTTKTTPLALDFTKRQTIYVPAGLQITKLMSQVTLGDGSNGFALSAGDYNLNGLVTVLEPNHNAMKLSAFTTSAVTTGATLDYDVNFNKQVEWPGFGGSKVGREDWSIIFGNLDKFSIVPDR